ncbi:MAG TPA: hypothetical protein GXZ90_06995 [Clostridiales bacterium]|nr:hypothetical protein [Clostridiales bacterium]
MVGVMQFVIYIPIIFIVLILLSKYKTYNIIKTNKEELIKSWGKDPNNDFSSVKLDYIKSYYNSTKDNKNDIDDITWNDLDMDYIYMIINNTGSSIGEEYLYSLLRKPCYNDLDLQERNRVIKFLSENEKSRIDLQQRFEFIGKLQATSFFKYINNLDNLKQKKSTANYLMAFSLIASIILSFIKPGIGVPLTIFFVSNNIIKYYKTKADIEPYLITFSYIIRLLKYSKKIYDLNITELKEYNQKINLNTKKFKSFKRGSWILSSANLSDSVIDMILDYIRILFHIDIIKFNSMHKILIKQKDDLLNIFDIIGFLDSMVATASFRKMLKYYSEPKLANNKKPNIEIIDLYHPLILDPIPNSINEDQSMLITGSNASGKSTFIKTVAINAILSQTIFTSLSKSYKASFFKIFSSMALRDNIFNNESYYIVEIKSLKRILDVMDNDIPTLCFVDEVLRGTNTLERIAASSRILKEFSVQNALVLAATHDIELTYILEEYYSNYHFQENVIENEIFFDYKIHQGRSQSRNAIKLLSILGYDNKIICDAESAIDFFVNNNEWDIIV